MIVALIAGGWIALGTIVGLWLGKVIQKAEHEARMADLYRRREARERADRLREETR